MDSLNTSLVFTPLAFTRNPISHFVAPAPHTLTERETLRYLLEIHAPSNSQSPDFSLTATLEAREQPPRPPFTTSDGVNFLINNQQNGLIDGLLSSQKPAYKQKNIAVVSTLTTPYYVVEKIQGGTPVQNSSVSKPVQWAYKGGVSAKDFELYQDVFFTQHLSESRSFLTFQPAVKYVSPDQEEYLYFLLNFSPLPESVNVRVEITRFDGSKEVVTKQSLPRLIANQVLCVPVGAVALALGKIKSYRVWLSDQANLRLTEVRTYLLDYTPYTSVSYILFANSLGTFDTVRFTGQRVTSLQADKQTYTTSNPDIPGSGLVKVLSGAFSEQYSLNSGYHGHNITTYISYLQELIYASDHYLITSSGHIPVICRQNEYISGITDSRELLYHDFIFTAANVSTSFSALPSIVPLPSRPVAYVAVDPIFMLRSDGYRNGYIKGTRLKQVYADTFEDVLPLRLKPNTEGDPDYLAPHYDDSIAGTTPFPSVEISRTGSFVPLNCALYTYPAPAVITIDSGAFGGENQANADALAEAEFKRTDTQIYANTYGVCNPSPWMYYRIVPEGFAFFKTNKPSGSSVFKRDFSIGAMGNDTGLSLSHSGSPHVYYAGQWDIQLPTTFSPVLPWQFRINTSGINRVRIFVNGASVYDVSSPFISTFVSLPHSAIPSGARVYVQID